MPAFSRTSLAVLVVTVLAATIDVTSAFVVVPSSSSPAPHQTTTASRSSATRLFFFGDAFKNDDSLGKVQNAGLKNGPKYNDAVTVNGKAVQGAVAGQKLTAVAAKARVKIPVNCQKGDCGTCVVKLNGRQVKACQTSLPSGKAAIVTL